ncbi:hypothetical protein DVR14_24990 (plasmid) [Natrinema thermotolerans]|nr:hypothetical protein DVR14_24990 [Natrinema thermotolerans]
MYSLYLPLIHALLSDSGPILGSRPFGTSVFELSAELFVESTEYETEMDTSRSNHGLSAYFLFLLGAVFIGPLEAVLGLALYWLLGSQEESPQTESHFQH